MATVIKNDGFDVGKFVEVFKHGPDGEESVARYEVKSRKPHSVTLKNPESPFGCKWRLFKHSDGRWIGCQDVQAISTKSVRYYIKPTSEG